MVLNAHSGEADHRSGLLATPQLAEYPGAAVVDLSGADRSPPVSAEPAAPPLTYRPCPTTIRPPGCEQVGRLGITPASRCALARQRALHRRSHPVTDGFRGPPESLGMGE